MPEDANYYDRFADSEQKTQKPEKQKKALSGDAGLSLVKVYGYMFIGLLITAVIAGGLGALFRYILGIDYNVDIDTKLATTSVVILLIALVVSFIAILVLSFVVPFQVARGKRSILVPSILYAVFMGIALSTLCIFIDWSILGITFGITALVFGLMSLIALLSKGRLNGLAIAAMGLFIGAAFLSIILLVLMLVGYFSGTLYWIISFAVFAAVMLITIWDMARIKNIAQKGEMTNNISLYCAYILYNDFIIIFLRILRFVLIIMANKK